MNEPQQPAARWTSYGHWTEDGQIVLGCYGQVVYRLLPAVAQALDLFDDCD